MLSGPAGTGKSVGCFWRIHMGLLKHPGAKVLALRKTRESLVATGIDTYRKRIRPDLAGVTFFSGNKEEPASFRYPNGARLELGGLDSVDAVQKVMSGDYDLVYVQEAADITENDWESLTTRLRNGQMPYQQILGDCNPQGPTHWIKRRADAGTLTMIESRHEDNPVLWQGGDWTDAGRSYLAKLDRLTGVRKERLRHGRWVAAEGVVYDDFDRAIHLIDRFDIPKEWRRFRSIDFGYTNPFVCQWWAVDPDGRLYLYREIYKTQTLVSDHAKRIHHYTGGERISGSVSDHDAEDRATLHAEKIPTTPARKEITVGIQKVQDRLRVQEDGKPRLYILRDSLVERDESLMEAGKPYCTDQEFDSYVWAKAVDGRPIKEIPLDLDNHGMDAMRYVVMHVDRASRVATPASVTQTPRWTSHSYD